MAHRRSSLKKIRVDKKRRERNIDAKSDLRTALKKLTRLIADKKFKEAEAESRLAFSKLDKAVKKGLLHDNKAARQKSRLTLKINSLKISK